MFDTYHVSLSCPIDDVPITEWQGKDGPCASLNWRRDEIEPEEAVEGQLADERLPPIFIFSEHCGDHQPKANAEGYGEKWARMLTERTAEATFAAADAINAPDWAAYAADDALAAADAAGHVAVHASANAASATHDFDYDDHAITLLRRLIDIGGAK